MRPYLWAFLASAVTSALASEPHWTDVMHMSNTDAASGVRQESVIKFDENSFQRKGDLTLVNTLAHQEVFFLSGDVSVSDIVIQMAYNCSQRKQAAMQLISVKVVKRHHDGTTTDLTPAARAAFDTSANGTFHETKETEDFARACAHKW